MFEQRVYLYITPFFPSLGNWRGAYCFDFVKALMRQVKEGGGSEVEGRGGGGGEAESRGGAWRVLVFVPGAGDDYEIDGVRVCRFPTRQLPSNIFPFLFRRYNERSFLNKARDVMRREEAKPDCATAPRVAVCHAHTANYAIYALAAKRAFGCKALLHHHDLASFGLNMGVLRHCWIYNMIQFPILRRMHEKIDCHVFISEAVRRSFLAAPDTSWTEYGEYKKQMRWLPYRPVKIKGLIILHNGVDKSIFYSNHQSPTTNHCFTIGCVGNFSKLKGQDVLLRAVARLKDEGSRLKVKFVGTGETLESCKRFAEEKGIDAEFLTEMRHEELPDFYRSLDLFVLPSKFEGFGCVFTEAWACGVPFITCEGQGIEDLIPNEERSKWLCRPRDPEDLANKISNYMSHRWEQKLSGPIGINDLVSEFVRKIQDLSLLEKL